MGNGFQCYFRELLNMYLGIRICKNYCRILKIILVPDFCPLKLKIAQLNFLYDFVLTYLDLQSTFLSLYVGWNKNFVSF